MKTRRKKTALVGSILLLSTVFIFSQETLPQKTSPQDTKKSKDMEKLQSFCREYKIKNVKYYENLSSTDTVIKGSSHRGSSAYFDTRGNLVQLAVENAKLDNVTMDGFKKLNALIFKKCGSTTLSLTNPPSLTGL